MVKRALLPLVALGAGIASIVYGALFHTAAVDTISERQVSIAVPTLPGMGEAQFGPQERPAAEAAQEPPAAEKGTVGGDVDPFRSPGPGAAAGHSDNPFESRPLPPELPPMRLEKITEKVIEVGEEPESVIVREMTVGGMMRLANGHLKRTYSGKTPSLCPS